MDTSDHELSHYFKETGAVANGLTGEEKCVGELAVHFQLELNALGVLSVTADKYVED